MESQLCCTLCRSCCSLYWCPLSQKLFLIYIIRLHGSRATPHTCTSCWDKYSSLGRLLLSIPLFIFRPELTQNFNCWVTSLGKCHCQLFMCGVRSTLIAFFLFSLTSIMWPPDPDFDIKQELAEPGKLSRLSWTFQNNPRWGEGHGSM